MENPTPTSNARPGKRKPHPFRTAVLRGLGLVTPPLLTIVLFLWAWSTIESYVLTPLEGAAKYVIVWSVEDVLPEIPPEVDPDAISVAVEGRQVKLRELFPQQVPAYKNLRKEVARRGGWDLSFKYDGRVYFPVEGGEWIPQTVVDEVLLIPGISSPTTSYEYYEQYVRVKYLNRSQTVPIFLLVFVLILYLLGKFLAAGVGRMLWNTGEAIITRLPVIRTVYTSVKQVTDFVFSEREVEYNRVVAVEYPRRGVWSIGFVTGESMLAIRKAANEPVLTVLMPTSPMPATGFTVTVLQSETVELDISVDQAIQFVVSCGVVVPPSQQFSKADFADLVQKKIAETAG